MILRTSRPRHVSVAPHVSNTFAVVGMSLVRISLVLGVLASCCALPAQAQTGGAAVTVTLVRWPYT